MTKELTCADRVSEEWRDRREDILFLLACNNNEAFEQFSWLGLTMYQLINPIKNKDFTDCNFHMEARRTKLDFMITGISNTGFFTGSTGPA